MASLSAASALSAAKAAPAPLVDLDVEPLPDSAVEICGTKTRFVAAAFSNRLFLTITQLPSFGSLYLAEAETYPDGSRFFNIRALLGGKAYTTEDGEDIDDAPLLLVRRVAEMVHDDLGTDLLLSLGIKPNSPSCSIEGVKEMLAYLDKNKEQLWKRHRQAQRAAVAAGGAGSAGSAGGKSAEQDEEENEGRGAGGAAAAPMALRDGGGDATSVSMASGEGLSEEERVALMNKWTTTIRAGPRAKAMGSAGDETAIAELLAAEARSGGIV